MKSEVMSRHPVEAAGYTCLEFREERRVQVRHQCHIGIFKTMRLGEVTRGVCAERDSPRTDSWGTLMSDG